MAIIDGHIECGKCGEFKPLDAFTPYVAKYGSGYCRDCSSAYLRANRDRSPEQFQAYNEARDPDAVRRSQHVQADDKFRALPVRRQRELRREKHLHHRYGLTPDAYDALLAAQGGGCGCCGTKSPGGRHGRFNVDHDHSTGAIRGLLCNSCNTGIGALGDGIEGVRNALRYLDRAERPSATPSLRINLLPRGCASG